MIWLNRLLKDVDKFYSLATQSDLSTYAALSPEMQAQLDEQIAKMKASKKTDVKEVAQISSQQLRQFDDDARDSLDKLNSWTLSNNLVGPFRQFMKTYYELQSRLNEINPSIVNDLIDIAQEVSPELQQKVFEDLEDQEENIARITQLVSINLPRDFENISELKYVSDMKTVEDAIVELKELYKNVDSDESEYEAQIRELAEAKAGRTPMWDEEFTSEEFLNAMYALLQSSVAAARYALEDGADSLSVEEQAHIALSEDEKRVTKNDGGVGSALEAKLRLSGDKKLQLQAYLQKYHKLCNEAVRRYKATGDASHTHFKSAVKRSEARKEYEKRVKADPVRSARAKAQNSKRYETFATRLKTKEDILKEYDSATNPTAKESARNEALRFLSNKIRRTTKEGFSIDERIYMISSDPIAALRKEVQKTEESIAKKHRKAAETKAKNMSQGNYKSLFLQFKHALATEKSIPRLVIKRNIKEMGIKLEGTYFSEVNNNVARAYEELEKAKDDVAAPSIIKKLEKTVKDFESIRDKAMKDWMNSQPTVVAGDAIIKFLTDFEKLVIYLYDNKLISDERLTLNPYQATELDKVIKALKELIIQYKLAKLENIPSRSSVKDKDSSVLKLAISLLEKIENDAYGISDEQKTNQPKEASINIRLRKRILQKIAMKEMMNKKAEPEIIRDIAKAKAHQSFLDAADRIWGSEDDVSCDDNESDDDLSELLSTHDIVLFLNKDEDKED